MKKECLIYQIFFLYILFFNHFKIKLAEILEFTAIIIFPLIPIGVLFYYNLNIENETSNIAILNLVMLIIAGIYYPVIKNYYQKIKSLHSK